MHLKFKRIFSESNKRLSFNSVQLIKEMTPEELSSLASNSDLKLEVQLIFKLKKVMSRFQKYNDYYIAISKDMDGFPMALIFPIDQAINDCKGSIQAIVWSQQNMKYLTGSAYANLRFSADCAELSVLEVRGDLTGKGVGSFILNHLTPVVKTINSHIISKGYSKDPHEYISGYISSFGDIPQDILVRFYAKRGYHLSSSPCRRSRASKLNHLIKFI